MEKLIKKSTKKPTKIDSQKVRDEKMIDTIKDKKHLGISPTDVIDFAKHHKMIPYMGVKNEKPFLFNYDELFLEREDIIDSSYDKVVETIDKNIFTIIKSPSENIFLYYTFIETDDEKESDSYYRIHRPIFGYIPSKKKKINLDTVPEDEIYLLDYYQDEFKAGDYLAFFFFFNFGE